MPLVRIDLRKGKQDAYRGAISRVVHEALVSVGVPKDDRFQVINEHDSENFVFDLNYLDIRRSEDLVIIQITWNEGRTVEQKKALSACAGKTSSCSWSRSNVKTGRLAMESRNTLELLANAIASARSVGFDVEVHVVGVKRV
jgi:Tautomerase enzyme